MQRYSAISASGLFAVLVAFTLGNPVAAQDRGKLLAAGPAGADECVSTSSGSAQGPEESFFLTISTPLIVYTGKKLIDWLFEETVASDQPPHKGSGSEVKSPLKAEAPVDVASSPDDSPPCELAGGVVYRLYRVTADGPETLVSPDTSFRNGERIAVKFATNLPGLLDIRNYDVEGKVQELGVWYVPGGAVARLGPYAFYGAPGVDLLVLRLYPCRRDSGASSPRLRTFEPVPRSRRIDVRQEAIEHLPSCVGIEASGEAAEPTLEGLRIVEGSTGFSVSRFDPVADDPASDRPIVTTIRLLHR